MQVLLALFMAFVWIYIALFIETITTLFISISRWATQCCLCVIKSDKFIYWIQFKGLRDIVSQFIPNYWVKYMYIYRTHICRLTSSYLFEFLKSITAIAGWLFFFQFVDLICCLCVESVQQFEYFFHLF